MRLASRVRLPLVTTHHAIPTPAKKSNNNQFVANLSHELEGFTIVPKTTNEPNNRYRNTSPSRLGSVNAHEKTT